MSINLGNVVGLIKSEAPPVKTYVIWAKILDPAYPDVVELRRHNGTEWVLLASSDAIIYVLTIAEMLSLVGVQENMIVSVAYDAGDPRTGNLYRLLAQSLCTGGPWGSLFEHWVLLGSGEEFDETDARHLPDDAAFYGGDIADGGQLDNDTHDLPYRTALRWIVSKVQALFSDLQDVVDDVATISSFLMNVVLEGDARLTDNRLPKVVRQTVGNANVGSGVINATTNLVALTANLTAVRAFVLPAASSRPAGTALEAVDEIGGLSTTNYWSFIPDGTDTINGSNLVSGKSRYGRFRFITNGTNMWTLNTLGIEQGGTGADNAATARVNLEINATNTPYTPADSDNSNGFFATLLTGGVLSSKAAFDRVVTNVKLAWTEIRSAGGVVYLNTAGNVLGFFRGAQYDVWTYGPASATPKVTLVNGGGTITIDLAASDVHDIDLTSFTTGTYTLNYSGLVAGKGFSGQISIRRSTNSVVLAWASTTPKRWAKSGGQAPVLTPIVAPATSSEDIFHYESFRGVRLVITQVPNVTEF